MSRATPRLERYRDGDHRGQLGRRSEGEIGHNCRSFEEMPNQLRMAVLRSPGFPRAAKSLASGKGSG